MNSQWQWHDNDNDNDNDNGNGNGNGNDNDNDNDNDNGNGNGNGNDNDNDNDNNKQVWCRYRTLSQHFLTELLLVSISFHVPRMLSVRAHVNRKFCFYPETIETSYVNYEVHYLAKH